jgi:thiamine transporter
VKEIKRRFSTKIIAETSVFVSLATVLSYIKIGLAQGGSVTAGSMVPILWLALRRGPKVGLFAATLYGIVQLAAEPHIVHPAQVLLDYPIAFGVLGVAGFFQKRPYFGITLGIFGRFIAHFISGIIFWPQFTPEGMTPEVYSAVYNGSYMLVELVISIYLLYLLQTSKVLNKYL